MRHLVVKLVLYTISWLSLLALAIHRMTFRHPVNFFCGGYFYSSRNDKSRGCERNGQSISTRIQACPAIDKSQTPNPKIQNVSSI